MTEKPHSIAKVVADARAAAINPRRSRRHLTCASCGQMYDSEDPAQVAHHLTAPHSKWAP
jgi:hypothetical protein